MHAPSDSEFCHNCGIRLNGRFGSACGQKALPLTVTLRDFFHDFVDETLNVHGRIFQSVRRLLLSPGFLTLQYLAGHRAQWVPPIRLYLISSVILFAVTALIPLSVIAQSPTVREEAQVYGRPGWVLENGKIRVALLRGGGHIAEVRFISTNTRLSINPMFIPAGEGYMGHLVCFPYFGPASAEERAQGLRGHGEAGSVDWQQTRAPQIDGKGVTFFYGADLPKTQYKIERAVTVRAGDASVSVEEWIENLAPVRSAL